MFTIFKLACLANFMKNLEFVANTRTSAMDRQTVGRGLHIQCCLLVIKTAKPTS
jgi:hypothetical protein